MKNPENSNYNPIADGSQQQMSFDTTSLICAVIYGYSYAMLCATRAVEYVFRMILSLPSMYLYKVRPKIKTSLGDVVVRRVSDMSGGYRDITNNFNLFLYFYKIAAANSIAGSESFSMQKAAELLQTTAMFVVYQVVNDADEAVDCVSSFTAKLTNNVAVREMKNITEEACFGEVNFELST